FMFAVLRHVCTALVLSLVVAPSAQPGETFTQVPEVVAAKTFGAEDVGDAFLLPPGFQVERLFTVPKDTLGSWVAITFDDKGRLIASDQGNMGLCRITPPGLGSKAPTKIER